MAMLWRFGRDRRGVTAVEYAFIAAFVAVVAYGGISIYGQKVKVMWDRIGTSVPNI